MKAERVKLLIVSEVLTGGGAERVVSTLLAHLDRNQFEPLLCLLRNEISYPVPADVPVTALAHVDKWTIGRTVCRLRDQIVSTRPAVVFSAISYVGHFVAAAIRPLEQKPTWIAGIGDNLTLRHRGWRRPLLNALMKRDFRLVDRFVPYSHGLATTLAQFYPASRNRVSIAETPCDFEQIDKLAGEPIVLPLAKNVPLIVSVGRLHALKRPDVLIDAFANLPQRHSTQLWIYGDGPLRRSVEDRIARHGLAPQIRLMGFCDNPFAILKRATLFVLTSDTEGLPNALIEAQGLGIPAVATRCPHGPDEIIQDGDTGFLTPVGDIPAIASAMQRLLGDPALRDRMGTEAACRTRNKFSVPALLPRWQELLAGG